MIRDLRMHIVLFCLALFLVTSDCIAQTTSGWGVGFGYTDFKIAMNDNSIFGLNSENKLDSIESTEFIFAPSLAFSYWKNDISGVPNLDYSIRWRFGRGDVAISDTSLDRSAPQFLSSGDFIMHYNLWNKWKSSIAPSIHYGVAVSYQGKNTTENTTQFGAQIPLGAAFNISLAKSHNTQLRLASTYYVNLSPNTHDNLFTTLGLVVFPHTPVTKSMEIQMADDDGDGVINKDDNCPQMAGSVAAFGCPDTDEDGVRDIDDRCPLVYGAIVNDGCPMAAQDADTDGVPDDQDDCPNVKGFLENHGCPSVDSDGDGVYDFEDHCPNMQGYRENGGCPSDKPFVADNVAKDSDFDGVPDREDRCPDLRGSVHNRGCPDYVEVDNDAMMRNSQPSASSNSDAAPQQSNTQTSVSTRVSPTSVHDRDGDGIPDALDKCPDERGFTNFGGCPDATMSPSSASTTSTSPKRKPKATYQDKDSDLDGIPDSRDKCPNIRGFIEYGGCPESHEKGTEQDDEMATKNQTVIPARDTDADGIPDDYDQCPETPGTAQYQGCPDPNKAATTRKETSAPHQTEKRDGKNIDTDGDGIVDAMDHCPTIWGPISNTGCPEEKSGKAETSPAPKEQKKSRPNDRDGDGVLDAQDKCPDEKGYSYFGGCPEALESTQPDEQPPVWNGYDRNRTDSDHDGIVDAQDDCPGIWGPRENDGCPENQKVVKKAEEVATEVTKDSDGDGIPDGQDRCPNLKGFIEYMGCPEAPEVNLEPEAKPEKNMNSQLEKQLEEPKNEEPIYNGYDRNRADSDHDGIVDAQDGCPGLWGPMENNGCPEDHKTANTAEKAAETVLNDLRNDLSDRDGDGVIDSLDRCPDEKGYTYFGGCLQPEREYAPVYDGYDRTRADSDNDGIIDVDDGCPEFWGPKENNGCPVDENQESQKKATNPSYSTSPASPMKPSRIESNPSRSQRDRSTQKNDRQKPATKPTASNPKNVDTDGDGIIDSEDKCPKEKGYLSYQGCPTQDSDGDGVDDDHDRCPQEAGPRDNRGCPPRDTDGDGIMDKDDTCPTLPGIAKYKGCPATDTDKDGIADEDDKCPEEAGPATNKGCPILDADKDGVPDADDKCPHEAGTASNNGCPIIDSDKDGIPDADDKCPHTAGKAEYQGCLGTDYDGDGVPDYEDECPNARGSKEINGCPDTDGDGVANYKDRCPYMKGLKDNNGCPREDQDRDGVDDSIDKCPTVPGSYKNNGCPEVDSDGDGVPDDLDECPYSKGLRAGEGCPDTDSDGVPDAEDKCPFTKGEVDNSGCPK